MSTEIGPGYIVDEIDMPLWGGKMLVVLTADGRQFYPLPTLCRALGPNTQAQVRRLQRSRVFRKHLERFKLPTRGGPQEIWCIEQRAHGLWLGTLDEQTLKPEVVDNIVRFQELLLDAAEALLYGERTPIYVDDDHPTALQTRRIEYLEAYARVLARRIGHVEGRVAELEASDAVDE